MIQEQYYKTDVIQSHDRIVVGLGTPQFRGAVSNQLINDATRLSSFVCIFRTINMLLHRVFQLLSPSDILAKISGTILDKDQGIKSKNIPNRKESSLLEQKGSVYDQLGV